MPDPAPTILITRPRAQAERFAAACRAALPGIPVVVAPILEIRFRDDPLDLEDAAGVLLTSENGVRALERLAPGTTLPAWCVGDRTAAAAAALGLRAVSAGGAADDLVARVRAEAPAGPLVHIRGAETRGDVAARLTDAGIETREAVVYDQRPRALDAAGRACLAGPAPVILPLFSPRSAALLGRAAAEAGAQAPLDIAALSPAVAEAWAGPPPRRRSVAARPESGALLRSIADLAGRDLP